jgi:hypothetical protein
MIRHGHRGAGPEARAPGAPCGCSLGIGAAAAIGFELGRRPLPRPQSR